MSFSIGGANPRNTKGECFENNNWWWGPLWDYVGNVCRDFLSAEDIRKGQFNDNHFIDGNKASKIATRLEQLINEGKVKEYLDEWRREVEANEEEECFVCKGSGSVNEKHYTGVCYMCDGKGKTECLLIHFGFSEENVREFAEFCSFSGGFFIV